MSLEKANTISTEDKNTNKMERGVAGEEEVGGGGGEEREEGEGEGDEETRIGGAEGAAAPSNTSSSVDR